MPPMACDDPAMPESIVGNGRSPFDGMAVAAAPAGLAAAAAAAVSCFDLEVRRCSSKAAKERNFRKNGGAKIEELTV